MEDFKAKITNPERAAEFEKVFGTSTVFIKSPLPSRTNGIPGKPDQLIYELDLELLTSEQLDNLVIWISNKFGLPVDEARSELKRVGMPILADSCIVIIEHPYRWLL